jgi:hypothetical protein
VESGNKSCVTGHYVVELACLACDRPPIVLPTHPTACQPPTFLNIRGFVIKILTKITAIVTQSWLDINFVIKFD